MEAHQSKGLETGMGTAEKDWEWGAAWLSKDEGRAGRRRLWAILLAHIPGVP